MRIAIAFDGSAHSISALKRAIALIEDLRSRTELSLVIVDWSVPPLLASRLGDASVARYHEKNLAEYGKRARTLLRRHKLPFQEHHYIEEEPSLGLLQFLEEHSCDLLVMGSHGRGAVRGALMGSVTAKLLARSTVPLLIVRPRKPPERRRLSD